METETSQVLSVKTGLSDEARAKILADLTEVQSFATPEEWREEYQSLTENPPVEGDIIQTVDGSPLKLTFEYDDGRPPFIYARIYVPSVVGGKLGWFAQSIENNFRFGWKTILLPKSRELAIKRLGLGGDTGQVTSLIITRQSRSKQSFLAEIHEW